MAIAPDLDSGTGLGIRAVVYPNRTMLVLSGELDIAHAEDLQHAVSGVCADRARKLVLNLSRLAFMDSTGVRAMLASQAICKEQGVELVLTPAQGSVRRVFEVTGLL